MEVADYDLDELIDAASARISNVLPADWVEANRSMTADVSPRPGKFSYQNSPYTREIINCLAPTHPARVIAFKKGSQIGGSVGIIEGGIGWIISQQPGNILFLIGHVELVSDAMLKVDRMLDACGIRHLIRSSAQRQRNKKTGDTDKVKEYPNGYLKVGTANHKTMRNISMQYGFIDDFEAMKGETKQSGSTAGMIEHRFAAYDKKMKLFYISTPELKQGSNIESVYKKGDQRKFYIPCPRCREYINLEWEVVIGTDGKEKAGITYRLDENSQLIPESVGYICQKCGGFFDDRRKTEMINAGRWQPTAPPSRFGYFSYHISSLYAPTFMKGWEAYVREYLEANPPGQPRNEPLHHKFVNLCLGEPYEGQRGEEVKATKLMANARTYAVGIIPESVSIADGNGTIVLLTCAADLNGTLDDARLDWEIVAWAESGASYSVCHGSIGTFVPREGQKKYKEDRERWTYEGKSTRPVWPEFERIIGQSFKRDTGRSMPVMITGIDTGHYTIHAYGFMDRTNLNVVGLKGDTDKYVKYVADLPEFKAGRERNRLYILEVNLLKNKISQRTALKWDPWNDDRQPPEFMNFPQSAEGQYMFNNYFSHFEAEAPEIKDGAIKWAKKNSTVQNHFWDVTVYNQALKSIFTEMVCKEFKVPGKATWKDYVNIILSAKK